METIGQALERFNPSQNQLVTTTDSNEISIYTGELTKKCMVEQIEKLTKVFPKVPPGYFEVLKDRFVENGFCDERVKASVNYVIDNYQGWDKFPNPANFIQFDKRIKTYTMNELLTIAKDYSNDMRREFLSEFERVVIDGRDHWVKREQADQLKQVCKSKK